MVRRRLLVAAGLVGAAWARRAMGADASPRPPGDVCRLPLLGPLLARRRMVRSYRPEPIDEVTIGCLIDAATRAPSAGNTQPWVFVVVRDGARRSALAKAAFGQMFVASAPVIIVACADLARSRARYGERGDQYAVIDVAFASLLLLLAVVERGLGACFVGAFDDQDVARVLELPSHAKPIGIITLGVPAEEPGSFKRRGTTEVVRDETWAGTRATPSPEAE